MIMIRRFCCSFYDTKINKNLWEKSKPIFRLFFDIAVMIPAARSFVRCFFPSFSNSLNRRAFDTCLSLRQIHLQQDRKTTSIDKNDNVRRSEFRQSVDHIVKSIENAKNDLKADFDKKFAMLDQSIDNEIADINKKVMTIDNKVMTIEKKINLMQQRNDSDHNSIRRQLAEMSSGMGISFEKFNANWVHRMLSVQGITEANVKIGMKFPDLNRIVNEKFLLILVS
jgi:hypothetical protein